MFKSISVVLLLIFLAACSHTGYSDDSHHGSSSNNYDPGYNVSNHGSSGTITLPDACGGGSAYLDSTNNTFHVGRSKWESRYYEGKCFAWVNDKRHNGKGWKGMIGVVLDGTVYFLDSERNMRSPDLNFIRRAGWRIVNQGDGQNDGEMSGRHGTHWHGAVTR